MRLGNEEGTDDHLHTRRERYRYNRRRHAAFFGRFFGTRRRTITTLVVLLILPIVMVQLFWSTTSLLPNTHVGSVSVSTMSKTEAATKLDKAYADTKVPIYFTDSEEVVVQPTLSNLGFTIHNTERVDEYSYPFLARLVPYSLFFYQAFMPKGEPLVERDDAAFVGYITERFGEDCEFEPVDGTIAYIDDELQVVDASRGGSCDPVHLRQQLEHISARLNPEKIIIEGTSTPPAISTDVAQAEFDRLSKTLNNVELKVEGKTEHIDRKVVASWVAYSTESGSLTLSIQSDKAASWLNEKYGEKYTFAAGTTVITLKDYAESSRVSGENGSSVNTEKTIVGLTQELTGETDTAELMIDTLQPAITYERTYSPADAALSAVMKNYATTHSGTYGVKMVELSGERRNASYNGTKIFTTASTYKLFVAYSVLLRIESGAMKWTDKSYGGQSVSTCFDRMIKLSDNDCAVWFLLKITYPTVNAEAHALGATHTTFIRGKDITSSAEDEAHFLSLLYTGQMLAQQTSRDRLITAMKGNVYESGIPKGIPDAPVADKVGFMDGLLHDAAIVYSKKGDYVLIIMTKNASWASIAQLASKIEAAR